MAAASDRTLATVLDKGRYGSTGIADVPTLVDQLHQRTVIMNIVLGTAANTNIASSGQLYFDRAVRIKEVRLIPSGTLTQDTTNFTLINLDYNNSNGGAGQLIAQCNTHNSAQGSLAIDTHKSLTVDSTNANVPSGSTLRCSVLFPTGGGTGTSPMMKLSVRFQEV